LISINHPGASSRYVVFMQSIGDAFARDHRRLEEVLETSAAHVDAARWDEAAQAFTHFRRGIERHMQVEEEVLFPAVEQGAETPLTAILRKGHHDLRIFFDELDDALAARDAEEYRRIAATMRALLDRHDEKEEAELYPAAQARLGEKAKAAAERLGG
jgi:hemerythrin-like domain-containing protein